MIRDGFIRVAASTPEVKVADVEYNREQVCEQIEEGRKKGASIMVFPELVLTGYTCGELFIQKSLLAKAKEELRKLIAFTAGDSMLVFVGLPWEYNNKLYNVAAAIQDGKLLGLVPKRFQTILNFMRDVISTQAGKRQSTFPGTVIRCQWE